MTSAKISVDTKTSMVKASVLQLPLNTDRLNLLAVTVRHPKLNTMMAMKVTTMEVTEGKLLTNSSREVTVSSREVTVSSREAMASNNLTLSQPTVSREAMVSSNLTVSHPTVCRDSSLTDVKATVRSLSQLTVSREAMVSSSLTLSQPTNSREAMVSSNLTVSPLTASSLVAMVLEDGD